MSFKVSFNLDNRDGVSEIVALSDEFATEVNVDIAIEAAVTEFESNGSVVWGVSVQVV